MRLALRRHAPFLVLLAVVAPAMFHFASSDVVASLGDDTISYLMLARYLLNPDDALIRPWVAYQAHFPPGFPAILAVTGAAWNFGAGHAAVAAFAVLSLVLLYRYAALQLGGNLAGFLLAALFVLTPGTWIGLSGILSETAFLFATLCALYYYEARLARTDATPRQWLLFGFLLAAPLLLRTVGATLALAYGVHVLVAAWRKEPPPVARRLLPFAAVALMAALWLAWRPTPRGFGYASMVSNIVNDLLLVDPVLFLQSCVQVTFGGWMRSFNADSNVHWLPKVVFTAVGGLGIAGAVKRAWRNHLDGWYVLVMLHIVFVWLFDEDSNRRLLYPLVPLLLLHAAMLVASAARGVGSPRHRRLLVATAFAVPIVSCLPAWLVVQARSMDREAIYPGLRYRYSDMTEYYVTLDLRVARARAAKHAAVLGGLESLQAVTPPGSRVMWLRPDYVVVLGRRQGVALSAAPTREQFLREVRRSGAEYIVVSSLLKSSMDGDESVPQERFNWAMQVSRVVHAAPRVVGEGYELIVLRVDAAAIDEALTQPPP